MAKVKVNTDRLEGKKKQYARNSLIAGGAGLAAVFVDVISKNRWVKMVAQTVQIVSVAAEWYFLGRSDGCDDFNRCTYIEEEDFD